jgi:FkbM family methyltransferase
VERKTHTFDNGIKVYDQHLIPAQRSRYKNQNVHEADEEDVFVKLVRSIPNDGCFANVGSAIGYYPILAKKLSPELTVHAVEPLEVHRKYFLENIELNGMRPNDFTIHTEGISVSEGYATFLVDGYGSGVVYPSLKTRIKGVLKKALGAAQSHPRRIVREKTVIKTMTLDKLVNIVRKPVDLLQMDVQGLELSVLKSGSRSLKAGAVKTFLIGSHGRQLHQDCLDLLKKYGYTIEFEENDTQNQPDGIIVASKSVRRLG